MKSSVYLMVLLVLWQAIPIFARQERQQPLPALKLQEYTIVGLEKIRLPEKQRRRVFRPVAIQWAERPALSVKIKPDELFPFARVQKPFLSGPSTPGGFVGFRAGSFRTLHGQAGLQYDLPGARLFARVAYARSQGHVKRADWRNLQVSTGGDLKPGRGGNLRVSFAWQDSLYGLWAAPFVAGQKISFSLLHWQGKGRWEQPWNERVTTELAALWQQSQAKQALRFEEQHGRIAAALGVRFGQLHLRAGAGLEMQRRERARGKLAAPDPSTPDWSARVTLASTYLEATASRGVLGGKLGILFQREQGPASQPRSDVFARAEVAVTAAPAVKLFLHYQPGMAFFALPELVRAFPLASLPPSRATRFQHRATAGARFRFPAGQVSLAGTFLQAADYPALRGAGSMQSTVPDSALWDYVLLPEARVWHLRGRFHWQPLSLFSIHAWLDWWRTRIRGRAENGVFVEERQLPYQAEWEGQVRFKVHLGQRRFLQASLQYTGPRYVDLANQQQLETFFLLGARFAWALSRGWQIECYGKNLLNRPYQYFAGYPAPGREVGVGLNWQF